MFDHIYKLEIVQTSDGASCDFSAGAYVLHSVSERAEMPWRLIPTDFPNVLSRSSYNKVGNSAAVLSDPRLRCRFRDLLPGRDKQESRDDQGALLR